MVIVRGDVVIFHLGASFSRAGGDREFQESSKDHMEGQRKFVLDLSGLEHLNSDRLALLVVFFKRAMAQGGQVHFCGLTHGISEVMARTKLDRVFSIFENREQALQGFEGTPSRR